MSLQAIINISNGLEINRRKVVGIQYARNELPRISETPTYNPWKLTVTVPNSLRYNEARGLIESLDTIDRTTPEVISFSGNPNLSWMFKYIGSLSPTQLESIGFSSFVGTTLTLDVSALTTTSPSAIVLGQGDIFNIRGYPYPFTSTTTVTRGSGSTIQVTTHRPNILSSQPSSGTKLDFGNETNFRVFCPNMPTYRLVIGGAQFEYGVMINNALIEFSDNFLLYEYVASA